MKSSKITVIITIVAILGVGGYLVLHKSYSKSANTSANSATTNLPSINNAVLATKTSPSLGKYLTDPTGKPLYTYGGDTAGKSNCTGSCIATWPAYKMTSAATNLPAGIATIKRSDNGAEQFTYNGKPLYYFVNDTNSTPTGNGVDNFSLARPAASSSQSANNSAAAPSPSSSSSSGSSSW